MHLFASPYLYTSVQVFGFVTRWRMCSFHTHFFKERIIKYEISEQALCSLGGREVSVPLSAHHFVLGVLVVSVLVILPKVRGFTPGRVR
jgi:hypothetical protein